MIRHLMLAILVSTMMLVGCQQKNTRPDPSPQLDHVAVDPSLLQSCPKLPMFDLSKPVPLADLYEAYSKLQGQYATCAIRLLCLIEVEQGKPGTCPIGKEQQQPSTTSSNPTGNPNAIRESAKP